MTVIIKLYKGSLGSPTTAYVDDDYPNTVFLNSRKLDRDISEIVNTIVHECVHAVDAALTNVSFGHGDNNWRGKGNSAPYWIGNLAESILSGEKSVGDKAFFDRLPTVIEESVKIDKSLIVDE